MDPTLDLELDLDNGNWDLALKGSRKGPRERMVRTGTSQDWFVCNHPHSKPPTFNIRSSYIFSPSLPTPDTRPIGLHSLLHRLESGSFADDLQQYASIDLVIWKPQWTRSRLSSHRLFRLRCLRLPPSSLRPRPRRRSLRFLRTRTDLQRMALIAVRVLRGQCQIHRRYRNL